MKTLLTGAAIFAATSTALLAQSLTITAPGYAGTKLFDSTPGFTITGLAADAAGNVFYIESDGASPSVLYRRSSADAFATPVSLYNFGAPLFGSFVAVGGGMVIFGESSTNQLFAIQPNGTGLDLLGIVANNYDGAFRDGSLFLSHNPAPFPNPPANLVSKFELVADGTGGLMLGTADTIIDTVSDYSGPIEFQTDGSLYYGATAFNGIVDLYGYSAAEVTGATGPTSLALDPAHRVIANGLNGYLAAGADAALWQTSFDTLSLIDPNAGTSTEIGTSAQFIGHLDFADGALFATVTQFSGQQRSAVFSVVPEPGTASLLAIGALALARRRQRC